MAATPLERRLGVQRRYARQSARTEARQLATRQRTQEQARRTALVGQIHSATSTLYDLVHDRKGLTWYVLPLYGGVFRRRAYGFKLGVTYTVGQDDDCGRYTYLGADGHLYHEVELLTSKRYYERAQLKHMDSGILERILATLQQHIASFSQ